MSTTRESIPAVWSAQDETFFRGIAHVFSPTFLRGASALLGSYDDSCVDADQLAGSGVDVRPPEPGERPVSSPLAA